MALPNIDLSKLIDVTRLSSFFGELKTWLAAHFYDKDQIDSSVSDFISNDDLGHIVIAKFTSRTYEVGEYCIYNKKFYRCTTAVTTAGEWNASNWTEDNIINAIDTKVGAIDLTPYVTEVELGDVVAQQFDSTNLPYAAGSFVIYNRKLYRCKTQVTAVADFSNTSKTEQVLTTNIFSGSAPGLVPASQNTGTKVLTDDGTWADIPDHLQLEVSYDQVNEQFHLDFSGSEN